MNSALLAALASTAFMTGCGLASSREFDMDAVGEALEACTPFTHVYNNPLVGEGAEAVVEGIDEGLCVYRHRMTSTFTVTCRFDEPTRRAVAGEMRIMAGAADIKTSSSFTAEGVVATFEVDGKTYPDTMTVSLNDGTCETSSTRPEFNEAGGRE